MIIDQDDGKIVDDHTHNDQCNHTNDNNKGYGIVTDDTEIELLP